MAGVNDKGGRHEIGIIDVFPKEMQIIRSGERRVEGYPSLADADAATGCGICPAAQLGADCGEHGEHAGEGYGKRGYPKQKARRTVGQKYEGAGDAERNQCRRNKQRRAGGGRARHEIRRGAGCLR